MLEVDPERLLAWDVAITFGYRSPAEVPAELLAAYLRLRAGDSDARR